MTKVYTKTGDKGETGRFDGSRVPKDDALIEVNGAIDECNSMLGIARSFNTDTELDTILKEYQSLLLVAGSEVTNIQRDTTLPFITLANISAMEDLIDRIETELPTLTSFILPAGGQAAAHLQMARALSRKVERRLVTLRATTPVNRTLLAYFNRLSDALFVLARAAAHRNGTTDEPWTNPRMNN